MDISRSGKLVIGDELGYVYTWDLSDTLTDPFVTTAHAGKIVSIAIGDDNETIVSAGEKDGTRVWKLTEKKPAAIIVYRSAGTISNVIRLRNGDKLVLGGDYRKTNNPYVAVRMISNLESPETIAELSLFSQVGTLQALSISDQWAAAGRIVNARYSDTESYSLDLWDLDTTNTATTPISIPIPAGVRSLAFSQDGSRIAIAPLKNELHQLWVDSIEDLKKRNQPADPATETQVAEPISTDTPATFNTILSNGLDDIQSLFFAQNDEYLIGANANAVHVWNLNNLTEYEVKNATYPVQVSADQKWLVAASSENTVDLYRIESILDSSPITLNTGGTVSQFAFSSDGAWLAVALTSGKVLIYQFPLTTV